MCELPIRNDVLIKLQQEDEFCKNIIQQIEKGHIKERQLYKIDNNQLKIRLLEGSKTLPHNLQQCFQKALEYEASFQLSEGVNMAHKMTIMNINVEESDEVNLVRDARARSNACYKCG